MTVTESAPADAASSAPAPSPARPTGLAGIFGSDDHKVAGRVWIVVALVGALAAGIAELIVSIERVDTSGIDVLDADWIARVFTFGEVGGVLLFLLPLTIGIATYVVPLQIGAPGIAFPRLSTAAVWAHVVGAGVLVGGYLTDGGPYGPDLDGVELYLVGLGVVVVAQVLAWICIGTTVVTLRAPGVRLTRVPLFSWSALVASAVWLLTLPVVGTLVLVAFLSVRFDQDLLAGGPYGAVSWLFAQPAVYALAIPVLGLLGEVVPVFAGTRPRQHRVALGLVGAFGALSLGAWALPGLTVEADPFAYEVPWVAVSFAVILPVLGLLGLSADTLRRGKPRLSSPLLFAVAAVLALLLAVVAGAVQAVEPIETLVDGEGTALFGTTWTTGILHLVGAAALLALLGAATYWAPKIIGRTLAEGAARLVALVLLAGALVLAVPELVAGLLGQPAGLGEVPDNVDTVEALAAVSVAGVALLLVGLVVWILLVVKALVGRDLPGDDPWGGHTLEWATSSPPPPGNFASLPVVTSEAPLYDARHREEVDA
ncbi:MAG: cbb3-type cytochrome c oxidase subunit I [Acidimicrobiia bacterium]